MTYTGWPHDPRDATETVDVRSSGVTRLLAAGLALAGWSVPGFAAATAEPTIVLTPGHAGLESVDGHQIGVVDLDDGASSLRAASTAETTEPVRSASGGIVATFESGVPDEVASIAAVAIQRYDDVLAFDPSTPVEVRFRWEHLGPNVLGYGGPTWFVIHPDLGDDLWPVALANTLAGSDLNTATPEVVIGLNADLGWHLDPETPPPADRPDLLTTTLHELGHGLGFVSSLSLGDASGGRADLDPGFRLAFDRQLLAETSAGPVPITALSSEARASALTSPLSTRLADGSRWLLHTPATITPGSSLSHFHEAAHPNGTAGSLMTPHQRLGETERHLDAATLGVLGAIGWPISAPLLEALDVTADLTETGATVRWHFDHRRSGRTPTWVQVAHGATVAVVAASSGHVTLPLDSTAPTQATVTPLDGAGAAGTSAVVAWAIDDERSDLVTRLYRAAFGRAPDPAGRAHWRDALDAGTPVTSVATAMAASPEFGEGRGRWSADRLVAQLYADVLGRPADPGGAAFWIGELERGRPIGEILAAFVVAGTADRN